MEEIRHENSIPSSNTRSKGAEAELYVARYLAGLGYQIIKMNYLALPYGEIDIVAEYG